MAKTNILVLQYVLSHVVYNGREDEIEEFFNNLIENVILSMEDRGPEPIDNMLICGNSIISLSIIFRQSPISEAYAYIYLQT